MKKITLLLAGCAALALTACSEAKKEPAPEMGPDTAQAAAPAIATIAADPA